MRTVKTLATFIIILSIIYVLSGTYLVWRSVELKHKFAYYGVREEMEFHFFGTIGTYLRILLIAGIFFTTCGVTALIAVIGLFRAKEWARRIWLGLALAASIVSIPWLAWCYLFGEGSIEHTIQAAFTLVLTAVSWALLSAYPIKSIFRPEMAEVN